MSYINWQQFQEKNNLMENYETYGSAIKVSRKMLLTTIAIVCMITPFTNWMLPIAFKVIKTGLLLRY